MKAKYLILFLILALIFNLGLACGEVSIEEDTEVDLEEKYISENRLIASVLGDSLKEFGQASSDIYIILASSDVAESKISLAEHKAITKEYIEEVKTLYDMYLEQKPPKRFEKSHYLFGKSMDHHLKSTTFLQRYIDTDDSKRMERYLDQTMVEINLANEYLLKATEQVIKLIE